MTVKELFVILAKVWLSYLFAAAIIHFAQRVFSDDLSTGLFAAVITIIAVLVFTDNLAED